MSSCKYSESEVMSVKSKKTMAITSIVLSIISLLGVFFEFDSLTLIKVIIGICILVAIIGIILGFISKKEEKKLSTAGIVVGFISFGLLVLTLMGIVLIENNAKNCVDNGKGISTCEYLGEELEVKTSWLREEQNERKK